jgi:addiction module HigA family antidote
MIPKNRRPAHPGEILNEEFLGPMQISQTKLAKHLGWSHAKVNEIVNGKRGLSPEAALSLSDAFRTSAEFWLNLQRNYDLFKAKENHEKKLKIAG